jgi:peroxiredoxin
MRGHAFLHIVADVHWSHISFMRAVIMHYGVEPALMKRLAALVLLCCACARDSGRVELGRQVPDYATVTLAGDSVSLAAQRDKVVILNIWATWCDPCRTEIPELISLYDKYKARGLTLIGVSIDAEGGDEAIRSFMEEFKMQFPVWHDPDKRVMEQFRAIGVPSTFLIDRSGILRWRKLGPVPANDSTLAAAIEKSFDKR